MEHNTTPVIKKPGSGPLWEGRTWVNNDRRANKSMFPNGFTVLSYNVLSDRKCSAMVHTVSRNWNERKHVLINEIKSYNCDIVCLQDVDHFDTWWQPQLVRLGYDASWKQRTQEEFEHRDGVVVAYKRELFQLYKTLPIELNRSADDKPSNIRKQCLTDDVALALFLQPWPAKYLSSAICVCSALMTDAPIWAQVNVREYQAKYICNVIERANKEFQVPVVIAVSMHDEPSAPSYHVFRAGRVSLLPQVPKKMQPPRIERYSRGSVRVFWKAPDESENPLPVLSFRIYWRPAGNTMLGFSSYIEISSGKSFQYHYVIGEDGKKRSQPLEERAAIITSLASGLLYEFKITALNALGEGEPSDSTQPFQIVEYDQNMLTMVSVPRLNLLKNAAGVFEVRESEYMTLQDWNVNLAVETSALQPMTQTTPRTLAGACDPDISRARVLPMSTNPREGWRRDLLGETDPNLIRDMKDPNVIVRSVLLNVNGFIPSVSAHKTGKLANFSTKVVEEEAPEDVHENEAKLASEHHSIQDAKSGGVSIKERDPLESHESDWEDDEDNMDGNSNQFDEGGPFIEEENRETEENNPLNAQTESLLADNRGLAPQESTASSSTEYPSKRGQAGQYKGGAFWKGSRSNSVEDWRSSVFESISFVDNAVDANVQLNNSPERKYLGAPRPDVAAGESFFSALAGTGSAMDNKIIPGLNEPSSSSFDDGTDGAESELGSAAAKDDDVTLGSEKNAEADDGLPPAFASAGVMNDDVILDGKAIMMQLGRSTRRHVHTLNLRSAYECYSCGGEPLYTESVPLNAGGAGVLCSDFILFSQSNLVASRLLSIPSLTQIRCDDPRQPTITIDSMWRQVPPSLAPHFGRNNQLGVPVEKLMNQKRDSDLARSGTVNTIKVSLKGMLDNPTGCLYGGNWAQFATYNPERTWSWLPNDQFGSSHLAIGCEFFVYDELTTVQWT